MKKSLLIISLLAVALAACSKKEEAPVVAPAVVETAPAPAAAPAPADAAAAASVATSAAADAAAAASTAVNAASTAASASSVDGLGDRAGVHRGNLDRGLCRPAARRVATLSTVT